MAFIEPLNLETLFLNVFAGSPVFFFIIGLIAIILLCGRLRMTGLGVFIFVILFTLVSLGTIESLTTRIIFYLLIIGVTFITAWIIKTIVTRQ